MAYVYHVTDKKNLPSIRSRGLLPQEHEWLDEPGIFVEDSEEGAAIYHHPPDTIILRFPLPSGTSLEYYSEDLPELIWFKAVSPSIIEYKTKNGYIPLK